MSITSTDFADAGTWTIKINAFFKRYPYIDATMSVSIVVRGCEEDDGSDRVGDPIGSFSCECARYKFTAEGTNWSDYEWAKPTTAPADFTAIAAVGLSNMYGNLVTTCAAWTTNAAPTPVRVLEVWNEANQNWQT